MHRPIGLLITGIIFIIFAGCAGNASPAPTITASECAPNSIEIDLIYAASPWHDYISPSVEQFNQAYRSGINPLSNAALSDGERPICVRARLGSSSRDTQAIVNAIIAPNNESVARPTIFAPSVSHWLVQANYRAGRNLFDMAEVQPIALTPIIIAIWESRLNALRQTLGRDEISWGDLIGVLESPNGWRDYGLEDGRQAVYYGHTDPRTSSTGTSALIAEYYAAARRAGYDEPRLTLEIVNDPQVQQGVREIEELIRHYSSRTDDYLDYIARGSDYVDFVVLEEIDLIYVNGGLRNRGFAPPFSPPEQLVALYPQEGTLWHERPMGIVNAEWVTPEQREAARIFIDYMTSSTVQRTLIPYGFRPVDSTIPLEFPIAAENGVDPQQPTTLLNMPAPEVIAAIQGSWAVVKKQADVILLIDTSGSMGEDNKLAQARAAAIAFIDAMDDANRVGLAVFNDNVTMLVPLDRLEVNRQRLRSAINSLNADGATELYESVGQMVQFMRDLEEANRIRSLVVLSDGEDTGDSGFTLNQVVQDIAASKEEANPVIVVPLAYGGSADINALNEIARASATTVQSGNPEDILEVLSAISSFF